MLIIVYRLLLVMYSVRQIRCGPSKDLTADLPIRESEKVRTHCYE
jgi:hypothetical protein